MSCAKCDSDDDDFYVAPYIEEPYDPTKVPMYCKNLVYADGQEYSLEEIRSRKCLGSIINTEDLKLKEINGEKISSAKSIKPANDEKSYDARTKYPSLLDAVTDKENYPDNRKQVIAEISRSGVATKETKKYCESQVTEKRSHSVQNIPGDRQQLAPVYNVLLDEKKPDVLKKGGGILEDFPKPSIPKYPVVSSRDKQQHPPISDALLNKENNLDFLKNSYGVSKDILPSLSIPKHCIVTKDKKKPSPINDALLDKENHPGFLKKSVGVIEDVLPAPSMPKGSLEDKTFTKYEPNEEIPSHLEDDVFLKSNIEFDVTSYTKGFNMPWAISTPGISDGKSRNMRDAGSETKLSRNCITEKLNKLSEPVTVSSGLSVIEETSRECTSGSNSAHSAASLPPAANDNQNSTSAVNNLYPGSVNGGSCQVPTMLGGGMADRSQMSRIPCFVSRTKSRTTAISDLSKDSTIGLNTTDQNESIEIHSKTITVRNSNKSSACASMDEICKQMKGMIIALDPFEQSQTDNFLASLSVPVSNRIGYYSVPQKLPVLKINSDFHLRKEARDGGHLFKSLKVIGQGSYAKVYKAYSIKWKKLVALKIQKPACPWEFYISHEIHNRITDHIMKNSFMNVKEGCFFNDASILVSDFMEYGTLLDAINLFKIRRIKMPEALVVYFTLEVLRIMMSLHSCKIIHADVKPDNFLLRKLPQVNEDFTSFGQTTLQLIDLGRCIDMTLYPPNTCFNAVFQKTFFQCIEMRYKKQWTYQVDMFHIASLVHVMIFGDFMDVICKDGVWNVSKKVPRNLNQDLWNWFFNQMLNIESCTKLPDLSEVIRKMERVFLDSMSQDIASAVSALRKFFNEDKAKVK